MNTRHRFLTLLFGLFILFSGNTIRAQEERHHSVHKAHLEKYKAMGPETREEWDSLHGYENIETPDLASNCNLNNVVYGWHPYWMGSSYTNYQWELLSDFSYFSYEVDPNTGYPNTTHNWMTADAVDSALANDVRTTLCVTLFSDHSTFFGDNSAQQNLIDSLIGLVQARGADGVNIDFEGVPASQGTAYMDFLKDLAQQMHSAIPGSQVSVALFAVDWDDIFDMQVLDQYLDLYLIMGYDYHYSGSNTAGPNAPLYPPYSSSGRNVARSVNYYLAQGASPSKLVLAMPYYGHEWPTQDDNVPSSTTGSGTSRLYNEIMDNNSGNYGNPDWHDPSKTPYQVFYDTEWHQLFYDNKRSLAEKADLIHQRDLAGMGIWALGYDDGYTTLWNMIRENFTDCRTTPCQDTLYDMGGPNYDYYNDEAYTHTIAPDKKTGVSIDFKSFEIETGYDTLWLYDGPSTNSPLIGAYTGSNGPGTVTASGNAITLRFKSDGATTARGWTAVWHCSTDTTPPTTAIDTLDDWQTDDFQTSFTDMDSGTGLKARYYQVQEKNGREWRANPANGFFNDNFGQDSIHSDWETVTGTWATKNEMLEQSDESLSNTNIHTPLDQSLSKRYLYHWEGRIEGSGNNKRAGFHFMVNKPDSSNRGDSYFVWFRSDDDKIQIYKTMENSFSLEVDEPYTLKDSQWYDIKVVYDRISGWIEVFVNNKRQARWQDPSPYSNGGHISFRTGNAIYKVKELEVYRSRKASETIQVGPAPKNDIRYQSQAPDSASGMIKSIVQDSADNLSPVAQRELFIDWSPPSLVAVNDGKGNDIDTTTKGNELSANWTASKDSNSGIAAYRYAIGTSPGDSGIVGWSPNGTNTSMTHTGLNLMAGKTYYVAIKAMNGADLKNTPSISNGQIYLEASDIASHSFIRDIALFPNPTKASARVRYTLQKTGTVQLTLHNVQGKRLWQKETKTAKGGTNTVVLPLDDLSLRPGPYILELAMEEQQRSFRLLIK